MITALELSSAYKLSFKNYAFNLGDNMITSLIWDKINKQYLRMSQYMRAYCKTEIESGKQIDYSFTANEKSRVERFKITGLGTKGVMNIVIGSEHFSDMDMHLVSHQEMLDAVRMFSRRVLSWIDPKCCYSLEEMRVLSKQLIEVAVSLSNNSNLYQIKMTVDTFYVYVLGTNHHNGAMIYLCTK